MQEIEIAPMSPARFRTVLPRERFEHFERAAAEARELLEARAVWNVNSTARGGGVVELLQPLVAYARGAGVDARWVVIDGTPEFFAITKRIHNLLHGALGDGGALDAAAREAYERTLSKNLAELAGRVHEADVVIVHDPQPAGTIAALKNAGAVRAGAAMSASSIPTTASARRGPSCGPTFSRRTLTSSRARRSSGRGSIATASR
jgi:trehalose synthase